MGKNLSLPFISDYTPDKTNVVMAEVGVRDRVTGAIRLPRHGDLTGLEYDWLEEAREKYGVKNNNVLLAEFAQSVSQKYETPLKEVWTSINKIEATAMRATEEEDNEAWIEVFEKELNCPLRDYLEYTQKIKGYYRQEKYLRATAILKFRVSSDWEVEDVKNPEKISVKLVDCLARFCTEEMNAVAIDDEEPTPQPVTEAQIKNSQDTADSPRKKRKQTGEKFIGESNGIGETAIEDSTMKTLVSSHSV